MSAGQILFSAYMQEALYGEHGYYVRPRTRFGRSGDFYTSAQVSPLFGELWAHFIAAHTAASEYRLVEMGPGDGDFAASVLRELIRLGDRPVHYAGIELSPVGRERTAAKLESLQPAAVQGGLQAAVFPDLANLQKIHGDAWSGSFVFANEWLDAIPCDQLRVWPHGATERLWVTAHEGTRYAKVWLKTEEEHLLRDAQARILPRCLEDGAPFLVAESVWQFNQPLQTVLRGLVPSVVALVDYGGYTEDIIGADRPNGSLRAYRKHQLIEEFLDGKGEVDLTYDVDFQVVSSLLQAEGYRVDIKKQGTFLVTQPCFEEVVGRRAAADPGVYQALKTLVLPGGMGERFLVLTAERS